MAEMPTITVHLEIIDWKEKAERFERACFKQQAEICNDLGRALGYPRYCDDQKNFPGATDKDGVCVGEHVAESLAAEAAGKIAELTERCKRLETHLKLFSDRAERIIGGAHRCDATEILRRIIRAAKDIPRGKSECPSR